MANLAIEPDLADARHAFTFENQRITIIFPPLPSDNAQPIPARHNPFLLTARIFMWNLDGKPGGVEVGAIKLSIEGLEFSIPSAAAVHPHINTTLFTREQARELDARTDELYFRAERALGYWLRVVWWKTGFHMVNRLSGIAYGGFDGGAIINAAAGTRFYMPRVSRTVVVPARPIMRFDQWTEVGAALVAGQEPPVWHDYLISANQRMASGDRLAAILGLAVAVEARIRTFLDEQLPPKTTKGVRKIVRLRNMSDVLANWRDFGLPHFADLICIKTTFDIRNVIMHSGRDSRADARFFKTAADAVSRLLAAF